MALRAALVIVLLVAFGGVAQAPIQASGAESTFVSLINAERTARGLPALASNAELASIARSWSAHMAETGVLAHNPNLASQVSNWQRITENVGFGSSPEGLHAAFMGSSDHRANILDPRVTQVGVGVAMSGDTMWVTQVFRLPSSEPAPPPPPPPTPPPPPEPAPPPASEPPPVPPAPVPQPLPPEPQHRHEVIQRPPGFDRLMMILMRLTRTSPG